MRLLAVTAVLICTY